MTKTMIFIDGTWLYAAQGALSRAYGENFKLDYGKLPRVLGEAIAEQLGTSSVDNVRTNLFGSYPENYDERDYRLVERKLDFFDMLREDYRYEVELYAIDFRKRRVRKEDREPGDTHVITEKCVDIALASHLLYYAAFPGAYDIAVCVIGDRDFVPVLQLARRLGKRVAIASVKGSCASEYADAADRMRLKDFDLIWLDEHLDKLELKTEKRRLECLSPLHMGDRFVYTDEYVRRGKPYYCQACRERHRQGMAERRPLDLTSGIGPKRMDYEEPDLSKTYQGQVKKMLVDKGYGFLESDVGEYFFHISDLIDQGEWDDLQPGRRINFIIKRRPDRSKPDRPSGHASQIELAQPELEEPEA